MCIPKNYFLLILFHIFEMLIKENFMKLKLASIANKYFIISIRRYKYLVLYLVIVTVIVVGYAKIIIVINKINMSFFLQTTHHLLILLL